MDEINSIHNQPMVIYVKLCVVLQYNFRMQKSPQIKTLNTFTGVAKRIVTQVQGMWLVGLLLLVSSFTGVYHHNRAEQAGCVVQKVTPLDNADATLKGEHFVLHAGSTGNHLSLLQSFVSVIENEEDDEPESLKKYLLFQATSQRSLTGFYFKNETIQGVLSPSGRYVFPAHLQPYLLFQVFRI